MGRKLVATAEKFTPAQCERIRETAESFGFQVFLYENEEDAIPEMADAEVLFCRLGGLAKYAPDLKWCASTNSGIEALLAPGVLPNDTCVLTNTAGAYGVTISEHVVMVTLELLRNMPAYQEMVRNREYPREYLPQRSIRGSRVTFLGTGDIGTTTATTMKAMGAAKIVGLSRSGRRTSEVYDVCDTAENTEKYFPETDILVMSLPNTKETYRFLSKERIAQLPSTAIVVNVGRGLTVDQTAMLEALENGTIAGAALDVQEVEPIPVEDPIWTAKNLVLTPHVAGNLALGYTTERVVDLFLENFRKYAAGEPLDRVINHTIGY